MTDIPITGAPELLQFLRAFPERLQKGALKSAATAAAKPIRDEARLLARKQSGLMAKAIKTGRPQIDQAGNVSVRIRLRGPIRAAGGRVRAVGKQRRGIRDRQVKPMPAPDRMAARCPIAVETDTDERHGFRNSSA